MKAVIYARYSSDQQREESIDAQIRACTYYCQREGIELVDVYADRAKSAMWHPEKRIHYAEMLSEAGSGRFDAIVVHSLSRFGRNATRTLDDFTALENKGVRVISVREQMENTPEGRLMLTLISGMNEYFSRNLAKEVRKGHIENTYKGKSTGGRPCLGYDLDSELRYVINPVEAAAVRLIFERYLEGDGYIEIAEQLNRKGYRTKRGQPFGKNALYSILSNPRYAGQCCYGRSKTVNGRRIKKTDDMIQVPGGCPAIISAETWERVQQKMNDRKHNRVSTKSSEVYILTGKLFCGLCGARMVGASKTSGGARYRYYQCNKQERTRACVLPAIRKDKIEPMVIAQLEEMFSERERLDELARQLVDSQEHDDAGRDALTQELRGIERKMDNLIGAIAEGVAVDRMRMQLSSLEVQRAQLVKELAAVQASAHSVTFEEARRYLERFAGLHNLTPEGQRDIIQRCVERITVWPDGDGDHYKHKGKAFRVEIILSPDAGKLCMDRRPVYPHQLVRSPRQKCRGLRCCRVVRVLTAFLQDTGRRPAQDGLIWTLLLPTRIPDHRRSVHVPFSKGIPPHFCGAFLCRHALRGFGIFAPGHLRTFLKTVPCGIFPAGNLRVALPCVRRCPPTDAFTPFWLPIPYIRKVKSRSGNSPFPNFQRCGRIVKQRAADARLTETVR